MIKNWNINSNYTVVGEINQRQEVEIKNEPQLFSASLAFADEQGGPITQEFLHKLKEVKPDFFDHKEEIVLDSRVHMLKESWYPAIPGYHFDDIPRETWGGQPDLDSPDNNGEHVTCVIGDSSLTAFAIGNIHLTDNSEFNDRPRYAHWHEQTMAQLNDATNPLVERQVSSGQLVYFEWSGMHKAMPATKHGFRMFIRASKAYRNRKRYKHCEIRSQSQVYIDSINQGW